MTNSNNDLTCLAVKPAIGANSRSLRYLIAAFVVAVYLALGFLFHLNVVEYQLIGVPILVIFQLGIHRQPFRTLWVRSGPPIKLDVGFFVLWLLFSIFPAYEVVRQVVYLHLANALLGCIAVAGAFGLAYALRSMRPVNVRQLGWCTLIVGIIGILPQLLSLLLPHVLHLHIGHNVTPINHALLPSITAGAGTFLFGPMGFMVEEVFFRGALDTYVHHGEKGTGWFSATFISALWGLWHLSGQALSSGHLLSTIVGLLISQIIIGVPLSLWWRRSGNLTVNDTAHALLDAVRNGIAQTPFF